MAKKTIKERPRRLRASAARRAMIQEADLNPRHLVLPLFLTDGKAVQEAIKTMPGQFRLSPDLIVETARTAWSLGVKSIALFPNIEDSKKDAFAKESTNKNGLLPQTVKRLKDHIPEMCVITDVAMDPYSSDGHDGLVRDGKILNDETLPILAEMALVQAEAGADFVAPSDMMDGRVGYIRNALDESGFTETGIISYCAKYASSFYGPFRDALSSAPKAGDKKTYQMDPSNVREALREARLDIQEGADILMVKPGLPYLDVLKALKDKVDIPLAAYNVSGEYAMIKFAAQAGALDEGRAIMEVLTAFRRAGADLIFTYHAIEAAKRCL